MKTKRAQRVRKNLNATPAADMPMLTAARVDCVSVNRYRPETMELTFKAARKRLAAAHFAIHALSLDGMDRCLTPVLQNLINRASRQS
jgi:hypothetical protein